MRDRDTTNAKEEFLDLIGRYTTIDNLYCCAIRLRGENKDVRAELTTGFTQEELTSFLSKIDVMYDSGYGGQRLFGNIWFKNGTWAERGEYDGSEWWEYHEYPAIPDNLNRIDKLRDKKLNEIL